MKTILKYWKAFEDKFFEAFYAIQPVARSSYWTYVPFVIFVVLPMAFCGFAWEAPYRAYQAIAKEFREYKLFELVNSLRPSVYNFYNP